MMRRFAFVLACAALAGCATDLREVNKEPALSPVGSGIEGGSVSVYQYPETPAKPVKRFSLWDDRQSRLFTDPRALRAGDILTVNIKINDRARFKNQNDRSRTASRTLGFDANVGWDGSSTGGSGDGSLKSKTVTNADGATERSETITLNVAAVVTEVLPNGNLMIKGSTLGIVNMTSALNRSPDDGTQVHRLAEGYIGAEEKNIDRLKKFL